MPGIRSRSLPTDYYPAFLNLRGRSCVVVGGGKVAERKALALVRSGARTTIISPDITGALKREEEKGNLRHIKRGYRKGDLRSAFLVVAATSDERINRMVSKDARCLVNVVDMPAIANFIVPSMIKRGQLTIAISTSGSSPAAAKTMRKELELMYGNDFGKLLALLGLLRQKAAAEMPDRKKRERFLKWAGSEKVFDVLRKKGFREVKKMVLAKMQ